MNILKYIQGNRKGDEAHKIELEAMKNQFLLDALDGYNSFEGENHKKQIDKLQRRVYNRCQRRPNYKRIGGIAATVLLVVGAGTYFLVINPDTTGNFLASDSKPQIEKKVETPPQKKALVAQAETPAAESNLPAIAPVKAEETPTPQPPTAEKPKPAEKKETVEVNKKEIEKNPMPAVQDAPATIAQERLAYEDNTTAKTEETPAMPPVQQQVPVTEPTPPIAAKTPEITNDIADEAVKEEEAVKVENSAPKIRGRVVDKDGNPVSGATISVIGANRRTSSNTNGYFEIEGEDNSNLMIRSMGYDPATLTGTTTKSINVVIHKTPAME